MPSEASQFIILRSVFLAVAVLFVLAIMLARTRLGRGMRNVGADEPMMAGCRWVDVVLFAVLVLSAGMPYLVALPVAPPPGTEPAALPEVTAPQVAAGAMMQFLIAVFLILYLRLVRGVNPATALGLGTLSLGGVMKKGLLTLVLVFVAAQAANWLASEWFFGGPPPDETDQQVVQIFKHANQAPLRLALTFTCVIAAPMVEELLYRGFIYGIARHLAGPWPATLFSAVLFSLAHQNLMAAVPLFVLGLGFAIAYERTKNLWVPMLAHALFNAWNLAALAGGDSPP